MSDRDGTPGETDIRPVLRAHLRAKHAREADTTIIDELGLCRGQVRVDVAVVNGRLHGYEIKSERDSLRRLDNQVELYGKVLDRATLVVGDHHLAKALDLVPGWWGVLRVRPAAKGLRFETVRRDRKNPCRNSRSLVELLWLDDAIALLEQRDAVRGVRGRPRRVVWDRVCEFFDMDEIAAAVRARLKARGATPAPGLQS